MEQDKQFLDKHLKRLLDLLWRNGIIGSEETIDLIVFLMIFRVLNIQHPNGDINWNMFRRMDHDLGSDMRLIDKVHEQIDELFGNILGPSYQMSLIGPSIRFTSPDMLRESMYLIEEIVDCVLKQPEGFGYVFDILIASASKQNTKLVFTPLKLAKTVASMVNIQPSEIIIDPACGSGNFLIASLPNSQHRNLNLMGIDNNAFIVRIAAANLLLNGWTNSSVMLADALGSGFDHAESRADIVLTMPPYSLKRNPGELSRSVQLNNNKMQPSEILYLWRSISLLKPGGRGAIILPDSFFHSELYNWARQFLFELAHVDGIVSLPHGMFKPSTQLKTSVLLFRKKAEYRTLPSYVWFYELQPEELTYAAKGIHQENEVYQALRIAWNRRHQDAELWFKSSYPFREYPLSHVEGRNIAFASYEDIKIQKYNLSMALYRYIEPLAETYGDPEKLLYEMLELEEQVVHGLRELSKNFPWDTETEEKPLSDLSSKKYAAPIVPARDEKTGLFDKIMIEAEEKKRRKKLNSLRKELHASMGWLIDELADWQKRLLKRFYNSLQPLAAHEAAKKIIGVQDALQTILLFESFGILERAQNQDIERPSNGDETETTVIDRQGKPLSMQRWQPTISFLDGENT